MTDQFTGPIGSGDRYDFIAATLRTYPDVSAGELEELKRYFNSAPALDIASLVSDDDLAAKYSQFRADHVDRIVMKDMIYVLAGLAVLALVVGMIGYLAP